MSTNPLNDISKIYLEKIAEKKDDSYLETDMKKRRKNNEKAVEDMKKVKDDTVPRWMKEGKKADKDYDGDGKIESGTDEYMGSRDKAIKKAMGKKKVCEKCNGKGCSHCDGKGEHVEEAHAIKPRFKDEEERKAYIKKVKEKSTQRKMNKVKATMEAKNLHGELDNPNDLKGSSKKAVKNIDTDVDGDVEHNDKKKGEMGEFIPSPDGKKRVYSKVAKEGYSDWRSDLMIEVAGEDDTNDEKIKEKKVNNKIKINPDMKESVENLGGTLLEETEIDEMDFDIEGLYDELVAEGYSVDDTEEAIEYALVEMYSEETLEEASDRYYDSAVKASKDAARKKSREEFKKKAVGRLRFMKRKAGEKIASAKKNVGMASAKAQVAAYNKMKDVKDTAGYKVAKAKKAAQDAPKKAKKGLKGMIKKAAQKVVDRMSEETTMSPKEMNLRKQRAQMDKKIATEREKSVKQMTGDS